MKVGIMTFPNSPSYGASLQMRALYDVLVEMGCDVEIINYRNSFMSEKRHVVLRGTGKMKSMLINILDASSKKKFREFENTMTFFPKTILSEHDNMKIIAERYDYLVCGSDQVWNPNITNEDMHYFFDFCEDKSKKVSYAASFGLNELEEEYSKKIKVFLEEFKSISVREEQAVGIVNKLISKECALVLDPTMLLPQEKWKGFEKDVKGLPKHYIVKFIFNYDKNVEEYIENLSKMTKLQVIIVGGTILSKIKNKKYTGPVGPDEWLYILDNADYIVTDSFHGAAFSIIFHKELFVSLKSTTNSRLRTLMNTFNIENRIIGNDISTEAINYNNVQIIMEAKRKLSIDYLRNSINLGE